VGSKNWFCNFKAKGEKILFSPKRVCVWTKYLIFRLGRSGGKSKDTLSAAVYLSCESQVATWRGSGLNVARQRWLEQNRSAE
jgi:hypothetical protein